MHGRGPDGIFLFGGDIRNTQSFNNTGSERRTVDFRNFPGEGYKYYFKVFGNAFRTGPYTIILENPIVQQAEQLEEALENFGQVSSVVNDFGILASFTYLTSNFEYINNYGEIGRHNPEEFFSRLFRNKYEQDPSPAQIARALTVLNESGRTQLQFLTDFAQENAIISIGPTIIPKQMVTAQEVIPNVPLDAAAFGETALIYNALLGQVPTNAEVDKLTLTPQYELRPLARAR